MREKNRVVSYFSRPFESGGKQYAVRKRKMMTRKGKKRIEKLERSRQRGLKGRREASRTGKHRVLLQNPYDSIAQTYHQSQVESKGGNKIWGKRGRVTENRKRPISLSRPTQNKCPFALPTLPSRVPASQAPKTPRGLLQSK